MVLRAKSPTFTHSISSLPWESALTGVIQSISALAGKFGLAAAFAEVGGWTPHMLAITCWTEDYIGNPSSTCHIAARFMSAFIGIGTMLLIEGCAHAFMYRGMQRSGATTFVGVSLAAQVLGAGISGNFVLGESIGSQWLVGAALLLVGVALLVSGETSGGDVTAVPRPAVIDVDASTNMAVAIATGSESRSAASSGSMSQLTVDQMSPPLLTKRRQRRPSRSGRSTRSDLGMHE